MAREVINVGAAPNDGTGDPIRTAYIKCNNNFGELYSRAQENPPNSLIGTVGDQAGMYAYDANYFYYCYQDYDGSSTIWAQIPNTVIDAFEIANGNSKVSIPTTGGNVQVSVGGTSNTVIFTSTGAIVNGDLTVTGNATLSGNIVGDRIINGTTSIEISTAGGNANITVGGTANTVVFSSTTTEFAGNLLPSANVTYSLGSTNSRWQDLWLSNSSIYMGQIVVGSSGNSLTVDNSAVVTGNTSTLSMVGNITAGNLLTPGLLSATGNISTAAQLSATGNIVTNGNLVLPSNGHLFGSFSGTPINRTRIQTTDTGNTAFTIVPIVPGPTNTGNLHSGIGVWNATDIGNASVLGLYSYASESRILSDAFGSGTLLPMTFYMGNTEAITISTSGNVGIGNTAPVDLLSVGGNAYFGGNIAINQSLSAGGNVAGNILLSASYTKTIAVIVANLPAAATAGAGARAFVTDSTDNTFAANVVGGGGNSVPVFSDGSVWKIG